MERRRPSRCQRKASAERKRGAGSCDGPLSACQAPSVLVAGVPRWAWWIWDGAPMVRVVQLEEPESRGGGGTLVVLSISPNEKKKEAVI